jgi:hypothetical protein
MVGSVPEELSKIEKISSKYKKKRIRFREELFTTIYNICGYNTIQNKITIRDGSVYKYNKSTQPSVLFLFDDEIYSQIKSNIKSNEDLNKFESLREGITENLSNNVGINQNNKLCAFSFSASREMAIILVFDDEIKKVYRASACPNKSYEELKEYLQNPINNKIGIKTEDGFACTGLKRFQTYREEQDGVVNLITSTNSDYTFQKTKNKIKEESEKFYKIQELFKDKFKSDIIAHRIQL